ncbi:HSCB C-terminal oligomerization domain-containing protein [Cladorrhinum sp. PSN259]|nr:HSCB C-terminal oligomerization domain-containing protein [Cladorrhinum sp. PSN259]
MRASILPTTSSGRRAASSWICATCRREAIHTSQSSPAPASRAAFSVLNSSSRTLVPTRSFSEQQQRQQRFFSASPSSQLAPSDSEQLQRKEEHPRKKIPQFYALFPDTLPDGPPPAGPFHIDVPTLRREFLRLQAAAHPDFHHHSAARSDKDAAAQRSARSRAEAASSLINSAFKTLSNPLSRAQYLLHELSGVDLAGDEAGDESGQAATDPELLVTVMEAREVIDEAETEEDLRGVQEENERRIEECERKLEEFFARGDWEGAKGEAVKLRYWVNIREGIKDWEGPGRGVVVHH